MQVENPYTSPLPVTESAVQPTPAMHRLAMLSWQLPLGGFLVGLAGIVCYDWAPMLCGVGILVFFFSVLVGFLLSVATLIASVKYRQLLAPALGGLICAGVATLPVVVLIMIDLARVNAHAEAERVRDVIQLEMEREATE